MSETCNVLGYLVSGHGLRADVERAFSVTEFAHEVPFVVACANPHSLVEAARDAEFDIALREADLLLPDGVGIIIASKILGEPIPERVAGMEFFLEYSRRAHERGGVRYFFLGSTPTVLQAMEERLAREFPSILVVGLYSPPFKPEFSREDNSRIVEEINKAEADVLWVGMTAPKQEKWLQTHRELLRVRAAVSIGAVFDFYAGNKARAPGWVRNIGLEWLPRLIREPRRLARRNFVSSPLFIIRVVAQKLAGGMNR